MASWVAALKELAEPVVGQGGAADSSGGSGSGSGSSIVPTSAASGECEKLFVCDAGVTTTVM